MKPVRVWSASALLAMALAVAGCGQSAQSRSPDLASVPLAGGARVVAHIRRCDRGADPYCAVQAVVVGGRYRSSTALLSRERRHLHSLGWTQAIGDSGLELAADSPGHKLRLIYATAAADLQGVDLGWIQRSRLITLALSRLMFDRASAISVMLETGSS
jgi:hypothetical protein